MSCVEHIGDASVYLGDCHAILPELQADAIITDPPYGLGFMGREWDATTPAQAVWQECLRAVKPGGHLLAFGGTRTFHRPRLRDRGRGLGNSRHGDVGIRLGLSEIARCGKGD